MRIGVCDDSREVRELIFWKVRGLYPAETVTVYESGAALLAENALPDILFLDIRMPPPDGMETARRLRERSDATELIFVTAFRDYVFEAFDVGAFHYLLKPFSDEKFAQVLNRAVEQCRKRESGSGQRRPSLLVMSKGMHRTVYLSDIVYAEVYDRRIVLHTVEEDIEYYGRMKELQKKAGEDFCRTHRGYLVNLDYVERYDAATVWLKRGEVPVARKQFAEFVRCYMGYINRKRGD